jgi:hypothetical protein
MKLSDQAPLATNPANGQSQPFKPAFLQRLQRLAKFGALSVVLNPIVLVGNKSDDFSRASINPK